MEHTIRDWMRLVEAERFIDGKPVAGKTLRAQLATIGNPAVFYHSSPTEEAALIRVNGLQPRAASRRSALFGAYPDRVYLTVSEGITRELQRDHSKRGRLTDYVVFAVDPRKLAPKTRLFHDPEDRNSYYVEVAIPPAALSVVKTHTADDNTRYYAALMTVLKQMGFVASAADDFAVSKDAILIYVDGEVSDADLARINAGVRKFHDTSFGEIVIQQVTDDWTELVGYLEPR